MDIEKKLIPSSAEGKTRNKHNKVEVKPSTDVTHDTFMI